MLGLGLGLGLRWGWGWGDNWTNAIEPEDSRKNKGGEDRKKTRDPVSGVEGKKCGILPSSSVNLSAWLEGWTVNLIAAELWFQTCRCIVGQHKFCCHEWSDPRYPDVCVCVQDIYVEYIFMSWKSFHWRAKGLTSMLVISLLLICCVKKANRNSMSMSTTFRTKSNRNRTGKEKRKKEKKP